MHMFMVTDFVVFVLQTVIMPKENGLQMTIVRYILVLVVNSGFHLCGLAA